MVTVSLSNLRCVDLFYLPISTTNLMFNSPIHCIVELANVYNINLFVDLRGMSINSLSDIFTL